MSESLEQEIRHLRSLFWSDRDPEGRGFVPLADAYRRAGELSQARELVEEGLDRLPGFSSGHVVAARVHEAGGADDLAETSWRRVLELDGDNVQALGALGTILVDRGEVEEGRKLLTRAGELSPRGGQPEARPEETPAFEEPPVTAAGAEFLGAGVAEEENLEDLLSELPDRRAFGGAEGEGVDEAEPEPVTAGDDDGPPRTRTLAELYARQGLVERAVEVYEHLLARDPGDEEIRARLDELRSPDDVDAPTVPEPDDHGDHGDHGDDEEVESLARRMSEGGDTEPVESPFAWHEEEEGEPAAEGRPVSDYFESLLAWRPGTTTTEEVAEPVAEPEAVWEPEPEAEPEAVDIAALAPDAPPAAPGAGVEPEAVDTVDIDTLAPDDDVVDIDSLAPDASPDDGSGDDFTRWLNQLK